MLINILFIIALTFPVAIASTAFSKIDNEHLTINNEYAIGRKLIYALVLALGQGVMYVLGSLLGGTFMHLLEKISHWIVLALCFSIYYRMLINTLKIKKGENLYFVHNNKQIILLSIALGVNTFIAGLMTEFYLPFQNMTPYIIMAVAFVLSIVEMLVPFSRMKLTFNSLLNLIFAFVILLKSIMFLIPRI